MIESASKLDSLASAMGKRGFILYCGSALRPNRYLLALEVAGQYKNPDTTIHALCSMVEGLPPTARRVWNAARREFDVGYELRPPERSSCFSLRPDTLERIAKLGAKSTVTYYSGDAPHAV